MTRLVLGVLFWLAACSPAPAQDASMVVSSDPELRARVAELLPALARRAGMELRSPVRVERRDRDQLRSYLRFKLDLELPPEEAGMIAESYVLLGLLPPDTDLREVLLSVYMEQVAGFYDPDSTTLFVLDDQPMEALEPVLLHELVHAVQDQTADLDSITARERGNDRQAAAQAAIEGHATLVMLEHTASELRGRDVDLAELPDFSRAIGPALDAMAADYPALGAAPPLLQESLLFPYLRGVEFVQAVWRAREGRPAPFGDRLPTSTEQVLRPERFLGPDRDEPTSVRLDPEEAPVLYENGLGQLEVEILLEEHLGPEARELAGGWDGDAFVLVEGPDGGRSLAWASVWDDPASRDAFVRGLSGSLGSFPTRAILEPIGVGGRPGALLRVGHPGRVAVSLGPPPPGS